MLLASNNYWSLHNITLATLFWLLRYFLSLFFRGFKFWVIRVESCDNRLACIHLCYLKCNLTFYLNDIEYPERYYVPFAGNINIWDFAGIINMSCMSYLCNLNVSSVLIFKLCKETRLLARLHCQTLLSDWLAFWYLVITYIEWAVKGTRAFVYINNAVLVTASIKLIESLRSIKRTTIRYNGLQFQIINEQHTHYTETKNASTKTIMYDHSNKHAWAVK